MGGETLGGMLMHNSSTVLRTGCVLRGQCQTHDCATLYYMKRWGVWASPCNVYLQPPHKEMVQQPNAVQGGEAWEGRLAACGIQRRHAKNRHKL